MLNKIIHASLDNRVIVLIVTGLILIAGTVALDPFGGGYIPGP